MKEPFDVVTLIAVATFASSGCGSARPDQIVLLDSLLRANAHTIEFRGGQLSGDGFDVLMEAAVDAQFVALGEQHLARGIPLFTTELFRRLHVELNFNYVALEEDPVLAATLSTP